MRSSLFLVALTLVSSAFAGNSGHSYKNTGVSPSVDSCIVEIKNIHTRISSINTAMESYNKSELVNAMFIQEKYNHLELSIAAAAMECQKISGTISSADASAIYKYSDMIHPDVVSLLKTVLSKKDIICSDESVLKIIRNDLENLEAFATPFVHAIQALFPDDEQDETNEHVGRILDVIKKARSAFEF
ncbi:hypothetical protein BY458DRAFT_570368 [Sporodiniella umbellata]|nr:hypothetical protein BY458DRAFT_570368 [Sporodiniella umbellata]